MSELPGIDVIDDILNGIKNLRATDVKKLKSLTSENGKLLVLEERDIILEIIALIRNIGFEKSYNYLKKNQRLSRVEIIRQSPLYNNYKKELFLSDTRSIRSLGNTIDGKYECPKCGSKKVETVYKQIKRSDEPMTELNKCKLCVFKWSGGDN
jgi:DNA-directed RNA polymerase subunit M/transcription elongation factor TFIIS